MAVKLGFVTTEQLQACLDEQKTIRASGEISPRIGQLMLKKGLLSTEQFLQLMSHVRTQDDTRMLLVARGADDTQTLRAITFSAGTVVGRYKIIKQIGTGGMGMVFLAEDINLKRIVALKIFKINEDEDASLLERFVQEAQLTSHLRHPNIVTVYEADLFNGIPYFAMEYIEGKLLDDCFAEGSYKPEQLVEIIRKTAEAVQYAHAHGVIHRDLKPPNIIIDAAGNPHILDFGLARAVMGDDPRSAWNITRAGDLMGTPYYMSPEQVSGRPSAIDARTDVWALGVVLYEAATGHMPFDGVGDAQIYEKILKGDPTLPRRLVRSVPRDLEAICMHALEKDKRRRYAGAGEFAEDLRRFQKGEPVRARPYTVTYRAYKFIRKRLLFISSIAASGLLSVGLTLYLTVILPSMRERWLREERTAARFTTQLRRDTMQRQFHEQKDRVKAAASSGEYDKTFDLVKKFRDAAVGALEETFPVPNSLEVLPSIDVPLDEVELAGARAHQALGQRRQAIAAYARAYQIATNHPWLVGECLLGLGTCLLDEHQADQARDILAQVHDHLTPPGREAEVAMALARACHEAGDIAAARIYYHQVIDAKGANLAQAEKLAALIDRLFPIRELPLAPGLIAFCDLDGDGRAEVIHLDASGSLSVNAFRPEGFRTLATIAALSESQLRMNGALFVADIDGDGKPEIVTTWFDPELRQGELRAYRLSAEGLAQCRCEPLTEQVTAITPLGTGDGAPVGLFISGPEPKVRILNGSTHTDIALEGEPSFFVPLSGRMGLMATTAGTTRKMAVGLFEKDRWVEAFRLPESALAEQPLVAGTHLYFANAADESAARRGTPTLAAGTYRVPLLVDRLEAPVKISDELLKLRRWGDRLVWTEGGWLNIAAPGLELNDVVRFRLAGEPFVANVDENPEPELCLWTTSGTLIVLGDASVPKQATAKLAAPERRVPGNDAELRAARELLALGLASAAEELFTSLAQRRRGTPDECSARLGAASCRMELGAFQEAAGLFSEIGGRFPEVSKECAFRRLYCFERMRDWKGLLAVCSETLRQVTLEPFERRQVEEKRDLALRLTEIRPQMKVTSETLPDIDVLLSHPLRVASKADTLLLRGNVAEPTTLILPFEYDGESFRISMNLTLEQLEAATFFDLQIASAFDPGPRAFAPRVTFTTTDGRTILTCLSDGISQTQARGPAKTAEPRRVTFEYLRELDLLCVSAPGLIPDDEVLLKTGLRLPAGRSYLTLRCGGTSRTDDGWATAQIVGLQFESQSPLNRWMPAGSTTRRLLTMRTYGSILRGAWDRVDPQIAGETFESGVYQAFIAYRRGNEDRGRTLLRERFASDVSRALTFVKRNGAGLSRADLAFFVDGLWFALLAADQATLKIAFRSIPQAQERLAPRTDAETQAQTLLELLAESHLPVWLVESRTLLQALGTAKGIDISLDDHGRAHFVKAPRGH